MTDSFPKAAAPSEARLKRDAALVSAKLKFLADTMTLTKEYEDALAPHEKALADATKRIFDTYFEETK